MTRLMITFLVFVGTMACAGAFFAWRKIAIDSMVYGVHVTNMVVMLALATVFGIVAWSKAD